MRILLWLPLWTHVNTKAITAVSWPITLGEAAASVNINAGFKESSKATGSLGRGLALAPLARKHVVSLVDSGFLYNFRYIYICTCSQSYTVCVCSCCGTTPVGELSVNHSSRSPLQISQGSCPRQSSFTPPVPQSEATKTRKRQWWRDLGWDPVCSFVRWMCNLRKSRLLAQESSQKCIEMTLLFENMFYGALVLWILRLHKEKSLQWHHFWNHTNSHSESSTLAVLRCPLSCRLPMR